MRLAEAQAEASGDLEAAEAEFEFERRRLERNLELYDQNVVSEGAIDGVRSSLRIAEARLSSARDRRVLANLSRVRAEALLASRVIRSPVAGVVVEVLRAPGEYADPPQILTVAQIDPLEIEAFLPSEMLASIEVGLAGKVHIESDVGGALESAVVSVDRIVDAASGTFGVRLEVANPELRPLAGLRCTLVFDMPMEADAPEAPDFANTAP